MKPAARKTIRISLAAVALAIGSILLGIVPFNAGFIRGPVETAVRDATGLELSIGDRIILRLGLTPSITSGGLVFGDPAANPLLLVDSLYARIGLTELLRGRVHVRELSASGIEADYCSPFPDFAGNSTEVTTPPSIVVDVVHIDRVSVGCGPPAQADPFRIDISQASGAAPADGPARLKIVGSLSGTAFTMTATGGELDLLLAGPEPYPVDVSFESTATTAEVAGNLHASPADFSVDLRFKVSVTDVEMLAATFGVDLPAVGALQAAGEIQSDFEIIELAEVAGSLGASHFAFDTILDLTGERPQAELTATIEQLDLVPFLEEDPAPHNPDQNAEPHDMDLRPVLGVLDAIDANAQLTIMRVLGAPLEINGIEITADLAGGAVELQSLTGSVLGGRVSIAGRFDSQSACPELELLAQGNELDLAGINAWLALDEPLGGSVTSVDLQSSSCGQSVLQHRDSLRAELDLAGGRGALGDNPVPLIADRLHLAIEPGKRSRVRLSGKVADEPFQATLAAGSLDAMLGPNPWPIEVEARGAGSRLQLNGKAGLRPDQPTLDAQIEFEAPQVGSLHSWAGLSPDATLPLRATMRLRLDKSNLAADAVVLSLGGSDLGGRAVWNHADDTDILSLTLRSSYLDLDDIGALLPAVVAEPESTRAHAADDEVPLIPAGVTLPPVDLDLKFDSVKGNRLDLQEFIVSGRLRKGLIDGAHVSIIVEDDVLLRGDLDLDLRGSPAEGALNVAAENVDIGRLLHKLEVADDLRIRADSLELLVTAEGESLAQLLLNVLMDAELRGFNWQIPKYDADGGDEPGETFDLSLAQVRLTTAPEQPTIWTSSGQFDDVQLELWMETPTLVDTFGNTAELPLTVVAAAGNDIAMFEARVDRSTENRLLAHVQLSGEVLSSENRSLEELTSPLSDYEIRGDIVLKEDNTLELPDLQIRLGSSTADGSFTVAGSGERQHFDIVLHAPYLQTDDLLYWSRSFRAAAVGEESPVDADEEDPGITNEAAGDGARENRGVILMVSDFIAEFRESNDLAISIAVDELRAGEYLLGGGELRFDVGKDNFSLKPLTFDSPGGGVDAEYVWTTKDGRLDASLEVRAEALSYGGLLRLVDPQSEARGLLYLETEISATAEWSAGAAPLDLLLRNSNGTVSFAAWPENIEAGVLDLWTANLVLALLPLPKAGEPSRLNCVVARLDVSDGEMKTSTALLDSTDTIIRGRGTIDLANRELDLLVIPQAKFEKFLSASTPVGVTGPFNAFQIGVEPAGFIGTVIKWWTSLVYVPFKWLTGERFPPDGTPTCFDAMDWELSPELHDYFLQRDFGAPPSLP